MEKAEKKSFMNPDEVREFPLGRLELISMGGSTIGRAVFQPGWRWSESLKPIAQTESCRAAHFGYLVSGALRTRMDDGAEFDAHPGDLVMIPPGHDGWVVGSEPVVFIDYQGMAEYALKAKPGGLRKSA